MRKPWQVGILVERPGVQAIRTNVHHANVRDSSSSGRSKGQLVGHPAASRRMVVDNRECSGRISVIPDARERHRSLLQRGRRLEIERRNQSHEHRADARVPVAAVIQTSRTLSAQEGSREGDSPAIQVFGSPCNGCGIRPACSKTV